MVVTGRGGIVTELDERSRQIFGQIVETYVETGEPVGSRTLSRRLTVALSPATIRNVMADLEDLGLLYAPHTSAGRLPTDAGLRLFVNGLMELGGLTSEERRHIDGRVQAAGKNLDDMLSDATSLLSGLARCAGLVLAPKTDSALKHIEFVPLGPGRAMVIMITENGLVENRVLEVPQGLPPSALAEATNYLNARLTGRTLEEARSEIQEELDSHRSTLDDLAQRVVETGMATWSGGTRGGELIVRGQSHLLADVTALEDLERIRDLFDTLETKEQVLRILDMVNLAEGVQIFIGAENELFSVSGCSMIVAPYQNSREEIVGAIGVIGPTRINYRRIIPLVDYTSKVISRMIG
ncbi:heat-inducible transcriptional repressor HrcA [Rhodospirillum rubrum]|uniref:heat-inducible transcriptional repressor HrcA n=1 Tax=Rhodospirillum rubrum TaxID=1085 RepID=UPI0019083339|nr:heat-inducible transcriptional repressor HrcA [Rhodospirillum rubrum]MBK1663247.1 heat-inducible transcriptional repressor HrcA [Rhodospirillum rubrum]MBK1676192.1 heat-inducible transcriptional repressor HrcA [Rhodospirillum rubrum]